jgi:hypothetical protein
MKKEFVWLKEVKVGVVQRDKERQQLITSLES